MGPLLLLCCLQVFEKAILTPSDSAPDEFYGFAVSTIDVSAVVVGAPHDGEMGVNAGAAYVHVRSPGGAWNQTAKLVAQDGVPFDFLGRAVAARPGRIAAGAYGANTHGVAQAGAVYVFEAPAWTQTARLSAADAEADDGLGFCVAISGNRILAGTRHADGAALASGAAYVFELVGSEWIEVAKLEPSDPVEKGFFGFSVSLVGDYAVVGSPGDDDFGASSGSVYLFHRLANGAWVQAAKLVAPTSQPDDRLGQSVALSTIGVLAGAPGRDLPGALDAGSVFVFEPDQLGVWSVAGELVAPSPIAGGLAGHAVSAAGALAVIGAPGPSLGSAFIARGSFGNGWVVLAALAPSDPVAGAEFGYSVDILQGRVIVGSMRNDDQATGLPTGQAYVYGQ